MNKPSAWSSREESLLLLNAYLDNELDAASVLEIERRLAADPALKLEHDRLVQLRGVFASQLKTQKASNDFRRRIEAMAEPKFPPVIRRISLPTRARGFAWREMAAAAALAAIIAAGGTYTFLRPNSQSNEIAAIVADHQRALLAATPFDVASSDRHTVKPWFDSKLALSPQVIDLSSAGFPLAGGRVEVIDGKPVPVLVYQRRAHIISVVAIPRAGQKDTTEPSLATTNDGYFVIQWRGRDFDYTVVSDLAENELDEFVNLWRHAARVN
ncbi:anti-sigma factor [Hyphomicrobium sp.]|uniref:anti-sigma factor family protein n=1 Tax=Hyphomicrobium sp. TaxID=82 RepID=UPI000F93B554|nr:anti-sigma factor [Hyphomicrobium sp.]RUP08298.1 MAG: anti-sigma factor [Hyphomicrobium sp.]